MTPDHRRLNQLQFGAYAENFVTSAAHAGGYSLRRLVEILDPQPGWRILDIATGGGHMALALASRVSRVVASDITARMLQAARQHALEQGIASIRFCQHAAEELPYPDGAFDCVTCRIAPHHFMDVMRFVQESARVLRPGGYLAVADNIVSGEPSIARFANTVDALRDPSHHWAYSLQDWETFYFAAGLTLLHREVFRKETDLDEWAARVGLVGAELTRLRVLLLRGPDGAREWFLPRQVGQRVILSLTEAILVGRRP